jgi:hypothetical protein
MWQKYPWIEITMNFGPLPLHHEIWSNTLPIVIWELQVAIILLFWPFSKSVRLVPLSVKRHHVPLWAKIVLCNVKNVTCNECPIKNLPLHSTILAHSGTWWRFTESGTNLTLFEKGQNKRIIATCNSHITMGNVLDQISWCRGNGPKFMVISIQGYFCHIWI